MVRTLAWQEGRTPKGGVEEAVLLCVESWLVVSRYVLWKARSVFNKKKKALRTIWETSAACLQLHHDCLESSNKILTGYWKDRIEQHLRTQVLQKVFVTGWGQWERKNLIGNRGNSTHGENAENTRTKINSSEGRGNKKTQTNWVWIWVRSSRRKRERQTICVTYQVNWLLHPELGSVINEDAAHLGSWSIQNIFRTLLEKYSD